MKRYDKNPLFDSLSLWSGRTLHFKVKKETTTGKVTAKEVAEDGKEREISNQEVRYICIFCCESILILIVSPVISLDKNLRN